MPKYIELEYIRGSAKEIFLKASIMVLRFRDQVAPVHFPDIRFCFPTWYSIAKRPVLEGDFFADSV
jgi:hypothetical protein